MREIVLNQVRKDWGNRDRCVETSAVSAEKRSYLCEGGLEGSMIMHLYIV